MREETHYSAIIPHFPVDNIFVFCVLTLSACPIYKTKFHYSVQTKAPIAKVKLILKRIQNVAFLAKMNINYLTYSN